MYKIVACRFYRNFVAWIIITITFIAIIIIIMYIAICNATIARSIICIVIIASHHTEC